MKRSNMFLVMLMMFVFITVSGCTQIENVPVGYVAKILAPTGWQDKIYEAGQVDIGTETNGQYNTLVLLEASSVMIKESFQESDEDGQDHRIKTLTESLAVDAYVNVMLPDDPKLRNSIFALVTPAASSVNSRVKIITLEMVYNQFAKMDVRSKTRSIFSKYKGYKDTTAQFEHLNAQLYDMVRDTFKKDAVPLILKNASISNIVPDKTLIQAENNKSSANSSVSAIDEVGAAIRRNPGYLEYYKWSQLEKIAASKEGTNTIIVTESGKAPGFVVNGK